VGAAVDDDAAVGTDEVRETGCFPAFLRPRLLLAEAALEECAESLVSTFGVRDPRPHLKRRLVSYVPLVSTGELGNPVTKLVLVIPDDLALHCVRVCRTLCDSPMRRANIFSAENAAGRIDVGQS
jgi:hypothetical protein